MRGFGCCVVDGRGRTWLVCRSNLWWAGWRGIRLRLLFLVGSGVGVVVVTDRAGSNSRIVLRW